MRSITKLLTFVAAGFILAACNGGGSASSADSIGMGKADAPVKMVEYASIACGHCAQFNNDVFPAFKAKYIDTGIVHYEMREIITDPANFAVAGFLTARCAGSDKYYSVIDSIFRAQSEMMQSQDFVTGLRTIALSAGLSEEKWKACVTDEKAIKALEDRVKRNSREGEVAGTPTFVMNGKKVKESAMTMAQLDAAVTAARAGK